MSTAGYVFSYLICMIPTYILPYLGSNSLLAAGAHSAAHLGFRILTLFCLHLAALCLACLLAWRRGKAIQKSWLVVFPLLATVFDLVPFLSAVPFVPTAMHLCAIIVGVQPGRQA